ncbi:MAG: nuclear transport factor 2 family protein [Bacteroidota bacterium]
MIYLKAPGLYHFSLKQCRSYYWICCLVESRKKILSSLIRIFLFIGFVTQVGYGQSQVHSSLQMAERTRFDAMISADTTVLREGLHPDLLFIHSNGLEESSDGMVASVASGTIVYQSFEPQQSPGVQVLGETALVDGLVRVKGLYRGTEFAVDLRYTSVYYKVRRRWLLIRWQSTKV